MCCLLSSICVVDVVFLGFVVDLLGGACPAGSGCYTVTNSSAGSWEFHLI
jgi:hypothetical protein